MNHQPIPETSGEPLYLCAPSAVPTQDLFPMQESL